MTTWTDITAYPQGDKEREPRSWEIRLGNLRVVVTRKIHMEGWYLDAPPFFSTFGLLQEDAQGAKTEALGRVAAALRRSLEGAKEVALS